MANNNGAAFFRQLQAHFTQTKEQAAEVVAQTAIEILRDTITATPVDSGAARSNWRLEFDGVDTKTDEIATGTANLSEATAKVQAKLSSGDMFSYITISNNLPYIYTLEFGGYPNPPKSNTGKTSSGYSTQAPQGMFRINLDRFDSIAQRHAARLLRRRR